MVIWGRGRAGSELSVFEHLSYCSFLKFTFLCVDTISKETYAVLGYFLL
jgi:hypothetical protein